MNFRPYEYLSFVLPGAVVLFAAVYGYFGWPWGEPGATALVGILGACFIVGHLVAAVAQFCQPILWGHRPSNAADSKWGLFTTSSPLASETEADVTEML